MFDRSLFKALMLIGIALPIASCTSSPSLTSIVVTPSTMNFGGPGLTTQLTATGYYTHPGHAAETQNITDQVAWASSTPACVTVSSTGLITSGANVCSNIPVTASAPGYNGLISGSMTVNVTQPNYGSTDIVSISVIPASQTVASLNVPIQYEAVGTTAGGGTVALSSYPLQLKWASSDSAVATINASAGLATTVGSGVTTITATFTNADGSGAVGTAVLTVTASVSTEPLTSLTVSPNAQTASAVGQTAQFLAIATTGTGTSVNVTNQSAVVNGKTIPAAVWTSSNPSVATVNSATGVATSVSSGAAVVTAIATNPDGTVVTGAATLTVSGTSTTSAEPLASMAIVPATQTALAVNQTANFIAIGTTSSGATVNLTNQPATINGKTVAAAVWSSSNPSVATVNSATGVATAVGGGATAIVAIATNPDGTVVTASAVYTVSVSSAAEPLVSLAIVPATQTSLATGASAAVNFIAIGTTSTGATVDMNGPYTIPGTSPKVIIPAAAWASSNPVVATINGGVATPLSGGATAITAVVTNPDGTVVSASAVYTVTVPSVKEPYVSLAIVPVSQTATAVGQPVQFIAIGTTGSGTTVDLTNAPGVKWTSSSNAVAAIVSNGVAQAAGNGVAAITAEVPNPGIGSNPPDGTVVSASASLTVAISGTAEPLLSLSILPSTQSVAAAGQSTQFLAIGTFSPTSSTPGTQNMANVSTYTVNWYSSNPQVATVCATSAPCSATQGAVVTGTPVVVTGQSQGTTVITAIATNLKDGSVVTAAAAFTVNGPSTQQVTSLAITPGSQSVTLPVIGSTTLATADFIAIGTNGSTGLQQNETCAVVWSSSNPQVATISSSAGSPCPTFVGATGSVAAGVATAVGAGTTTITAIYTNPNGGVATATATLTVAGSAAEPLLSLAIFPGSESISLSSLPSQLIALGTTPSGATVSMNTSYTVPGITPPNTISPATWGSSNTAVATVGRNSGLVTPVGLGTTAITASVANLDGSVVTAVTTVTVTSGVEPLVSLSILPNAQSVAGVGQSTQFLAMGDFSASGTQNMANVSTYTVDWYSSNPQVATICTADPGQPAPAVQCPTTPGLVTAVGQGTTAITAIATNNADKSGATAVATFTVTGPQVLPVSALSIFPGSPSVTLPLSTTTTPGAGTVQFMAIGTNGSTGLQTNVTCSVAWSSTNPLVATINSSAVSPCAAGSAGLATAIGQGTTTITAVVTDSATGGVVTATTTLTVAAPASEPLLSVTIYPPSPSLSVPKQTSRLLAIGTFSAAPITQDVTAGLAKPAITTSWNSSNTGVATVTTACPTGLTAESCTISACPPGSSGATCTTCPVGTSAAGSSCATLNPATPIGTVTSVGQGTAAITSISANPDGSLVPATTSFSVLGGSIEQYTALTIVPGSIGATSSGQQNQFIALATDSSGLQYDVTSLVVWKSNTSTVASICTAVAGVNPVTPISCGTTPGLVTAITAGSTNITATWTNQDNSQLVAPATYSVTIGASPEPLISINVVPASTQVTNKGMTQQFLAFGTFTTIPTIRDITDSVTWITLEPNLVSINSAGTPGEPAGLATAMGYEGLGVIYAEDTTANPDGTLVLSNPVTFTCIEPGTTPPICSQEVAPSLLATLTVFNAGSNDTNWLITAPSDTQITCDVITGCLIHCGPGSVTAGYGNSVCTGTYAAGVQVTLTASLAGVTPDNTFGGWTANCDTSAPPIYTPNLSDTCTFPNNSTTSGLVGDQSAGALFYGLTLDCTSVTASGTVNNPFTSGPITVGNGTPPDTFSVVGTLPTGLTLNTLTGAVTGTPTAAGSFSITAKDANGTNAATNCAIAIH